MIRYTDHVIAELRECIKLESYDKIFAITDENTFAFIYEFIGAIVPHEQVIMVSAGDQHKNLQTAEIIWGQLAKMLASRKSLVINIGGGMVTDLGGFCASTYMRGIDFINIPTTLLSMVDASVGGKTGVNFGHLKNYIGTFAEPIAVIIQPNILKALPQEELKNGWAEIIKHGIIAGGELWELVNKGMPKIADTAAWKHIIALNIELKSKVVKVDKKEAGLRKVLNLGHTVGHALETAFLKHNDYLGHGKAVAAGMVMESFIALEMGLLPEEDASSIESAIDAVFERLDLADYNMQALLADMKGDKKNHFGSINMALPRNIGAVQYDILVTDSVILNALALYGKNTHQPQA